MSVTVTDNPAQHRYEAYVDSKLAGYLEYEQTDTTTVFPHTKVFPENEGQGVGSALVRHALDLVRADGTRKAVPVCPFVKAWIDKHPEYKDVTQDPPTD